ncbi:MAG TPA: substrate-binding domain-containing protein [Bryobacteraceae bacterium]|jgi:DNA-binding LacI/PurR family transcriptional regulator|nr:substrate-binding domain-containing protein [Bryobacteraceae bacterium]
MIRLVADRGPKYKQVCEDLKAAIEAGRYGQGLRLPGELELAHSYGASRVTVGRALRELQLEGYVDRRAGSGTYVCAKAKEQFAFGLLIPDFGHTEIFEPICHGMMAAGEGLNYVLVWGRSLAGSEATEDEAKEVCRHLIANRVSGIFFAPIEANPRKDEINRSIVNLLSEARVPVVLLDRDIVDYPERSQYDVVGIDNRRAGFVITKHLINNGCRRVGFIGRIHLAPSCIARSNGYRDALANSRMPLAAEFVERLDPTDKKVVEGVIARYTPDGIVCSSDRTAALLMRTLAELNIAIPGDVKVVGFDDVKYANLVAVPLTTIHQPCAELGAAAIQAMLHRVKGPALPAQDCLVNFKLVIRESCGSQLAVRAN